ncbi:uncharacterized protein PRCAT00003240001 [Priceomyces carsonii]|uniref:uncharacterized protein n=1 Tax=Priceomyces carsonii TaxID=28549 RepID=UPI002ED7C74D|nr:unnamed protein product [Priceomyces carsonii]
MQLSFSYIVTAMMASSALVAAGKAPKIKKNPKDVVAIADFPFGFDLKVKGNIVFTAKKGKAVKVHVDMTGLPKSGGPFVYHIHEYLVPEDGDCDAVGDHFNPYNAPPDCDNQKKDAYCQVGDLSGKHGWIDTSCFETKYVDPYLSLNKKSKSYIVGRSIVFHFANLTKFACADIQLASDLRVASLLEEYEESHNEDLKELSEVTAEGYVFDEEEALQSEEFESNEPQYKDYVPTMPSPLHYKNVTSNLTTPQGSGQAGASNLSNATNHQSPNSENGSSLKGLGISAILACVAGLLI